MSDGHQQRSDSEYRAIFEGAPVAMWDEDFSGVKSLIDNYIQSGIIDIPEFLRRNPEVVRDCVTRVRVRHVNRVAREFYGASNEQDLIVALPTLFDEAALEIFREEVIAFATGAASYEAEFSVTTLDGQQRRVVMNVSILGDPVPDWARVVVTFIDITERRRLEHSLKNANECLQRVNRHLEQFAYAAAHDMREPLRTIALYAQLLQRQHPPQPGSDAEAALTYILDSGKRMETLVDDLLSFARAIESHQAPAPYNTDPAVLLTETLSNLFSAIEASGAQIHVEAELPQTNMQPVHLGQLFQNLLSNSIKYGPAETPPVIRICAHQANGEVTFRFADNGIGIRREYHEQIFGIFKRLHGREIEGNGVGLALCKKIVEHYGGRIWVESEPDQGATFFFSIPQA